jgi:hypothetical protein
MLATKKRSILGTSGGFLAILSLKPHCRCAARVCKNESASFCP